MNISANSALRVVSAVLVTAVWVIPKPVDAQYSGRVNLQPTLDHPTEGLMLDVNRFRPDPRDLFHDMDQVADESGQLHPLQFDMSHERDRHAAYGRNTWMMWCAGNEGFWDWLAQEGYGFIDLLQVIDSRKRDRRFRDYGLVNQPGMSSRTTPGPFGLYLDIVETPLSGPGDPYDERSQSDKATYRHPKPEELPQTDGVDPFVYGYPSGVIGLRLFPNLRFDDSARARWNAEAFYTDPEYSRDPRNVRPFRVGMSCAFCHVAPHPLNPPTDPEHPEWKHLSAIIGNQYFRTSAIFGSRARRGNFIWHLLSLAQPGTIDASLISTDHINNPNTMNAVFEVPARLARAAVNPAEIQGLPARSLPAGDSGDDARRTPRVLLDGSDSIGAWGALARVYLNIGTFYEEWNLCHNPVLGFTKQQPFQIDVCRRNSIYWQANEAFRVDFLMSYFTWQRPDQKWQKLTAPMKLSVIAPSAPAVQAQLEQTRPLIGQGRQVFVDHCMVCHSSKQPEGFAVEFKRTSAAHDWTKQPVGASITMPMEWEHWEEFKKSPAYEAYLESARTIGATPEFLTENFLSTDVRIPSSLVGTNAGRSLGTNALAGEVWSDFSSDTYKQLPAISQIRYIDAFTGKTAAFQPPGEGRGYCRPATLVGLWATAPFLHNNALGKYLPDDRSTERTTVEGRLEMFHDAIEKLLWSTKRGRSPSGEGGLRVSGAQTWLGRDSGWVFRTDQETWIELPEKHLRFALERTLPKWIVWLVDHPWLIPGILALIIALSLKAGKPSLIFVTSLLLGLVLLTLLVATGAHYILPFTPWPLVVLLILGGLFAMVGQKVGPSARDQNADRGPSDDQDAFVSLRDRLYAVVIAAGPVVRQTAIFAVAVTAVLLWGSGAALKWKVDGRFGDLSFGPIPQGTPVNAVMNLDPEAPIGVQLAAVRGLLRAIGKINRLDRDSANYAEAARHIFDTHAGPGLIAASKCPDLTMDRGHLFGESLSDDDKHALIAFLRTL